MASAGDAFWAGLALAWAILEWRVPERAPIALARGLATRRAWRFALLAAWGFLGWHLFVRHGVVVSRS